MEKVNPKGLKPTNEEIINIVKNKGFLSAKEILNNLDKRITLPGLMKRLKNMIKTNEIGYLDISKRPKKNSKIPKKVIKQNLDLLSIKTDGRIRKYYYHFPLTARFNRRLNDFLKEKINEKKYQKMVWEITREFGGMELFSISKEKLLTRPDIIKKNLRVAYCEDYPKEKIKGLRIVEDDIEACKNILNLILKTEGELRIDLRNIDFIKVKNKLYFFVNDELIPKEKIVKFLKIIEFPPIMSFLLSDLIKQSIVPPEMIDSMYRIIDRIQNLFIEVIKDSQVKI